jgi:hypothetical protein
VNISTTAAQGINDTADANFVGFYENPLAEDSNTDTYASPGPSRRSRQSSRSNLGSLDYHAEHAIGESDFEVFAMSPTRKGSFGNLGDTKTRKRASRLPRPTRRQTPAKGSRSPQGDGYGSDDADVSQEIQRRILRSFGAGRDNTTTTQSRLEAALNENGTLLAQIQESKNVIEVLRAILESNVDNFDLDSLSKDAVASSAGSHDALQSSSFSISPNEFKHLLQVLRLTENKLQGATLARDEFERIAKDLGRQTESLTKKLQELQDRYSIQNTRFETSLQLVLTAVKGTQHDPQFPHLVAFAVEKLTAEKKVFELSMLMDILKEKHKVAVSKLTNELAVTAATKQNMEKRIEELAAEVELQLIAAAPARDIGTESAQRKAAVELERSKRSAMELAAKTRLLSSELETVNVTATLEIDALQKELSVARENVETIDRSHPNALDAFVLQQAQPAGTDATDQVNAAQDNNAEAATGSISQLESQAARDDKDATINSLLMKIIELGNSLRVATERLIDREREFELKQNAARDKHEEDTGKVAALRAQLDSKSTELAQLQLHHERELGKALETSHPQEHKELEALNTAISATPETLNSINAGTVSAITQLVEFRLLLEPEFNRENILGKLLPVADGDSSSMLAATANAHCGVLTSFLAETLEAASHSIKDLLAELEKFNEVSELATARITELELQLTQLQSESERLASGLPSNGATKQANQEVEAAATSPTDSNRGNTEAIKALYEAKIELVYHQLLEVKLSNSRLETLLASAEYLKTAITSSGANNEGNSNTPDSQPSKLKKAVSFKDTDGTGTSEETIATAKGSEQGVGKAPNLTINTANLSVSPPTQSVLSPRTRETQQADSLKLLSDLNEITTKFSDLVRVNISLQQTVSNQEQQYHEATEKLMQAIENVRTEQHKQIEEVVLKFKSLRARYDKTKKKFQLQKQEYEDIIVELYNQLGIENPELPHSFINEPESPAGSLSRSMSFDIQEFY